MSPGVWWMTLASGLCALLGVGLGAWTYYVERDPVQSVMVLVGMIFVSAFIRPDSTLRP